MNEVTYSSSYGNGQTFAYLEYLPPNYSDNGKGYPLLISLHGYGWMPDGQSIKFSNLRTGNHVAKLFYYKKQDFPFIVISPQQPKSVKGRYSSTSSWDPNIVDEVLERVKKLRKVDTNRIYITGTSMGGGGVWRYLKEHGDKIAAAAPMAGAGNEKSSACSGKIKNVAVWGFHNSGDNMVGVGNTIDMVDAINACSPPTKARKTIFKNGTHNVWDRVYYHTDNASDYSLSSKKTSSHPYGPNSGQVQLFDWFLTHSKDGSAPSPTPAPSNKAPLAKAGSDETITLPTDKVTLDGGSSTDPDGSVASYKWTKVSGPSSYTIVSSTAKKTEIKSLKEGTYTFQLTVKDNKGASDTDDVKVTVNKKPAPTPAPVPTPNPPAPVTDSGENGLKYAYYEGNWEKLPNFSSLKPKATGTVANFDLSPRKNSAYYAFSFDGYIDITSSGTYTFYTASDDGSKLYIDGKETVNNDGRHERVEKSGQVSLSKGRHAIKVTYFDKWGDKDILEVYYSGPGVGKKRIPSSVLFTGSTGGSSETPSPTPSTGELTYSYYEGTWYSLPDFSKLSPKATGKVSNFKLSPRKRDSYFAFKFEGEISIASSGTYTFYLASDDGSQLFIDGKRVVNNDGLHAREEKSGSIQLSKGEHTIRVAFFEKEGQEVLDVYYKGPGFSKKRIPDSVLGGSSNGRTIATNAQKSSFDDLELSPTLEIAMYPNPASEFLTISNASDAAYSVISMSGKMMSQGTLHDRQRLDVSSLPNGLYLVKVQQENVQLTERILIQH